MTVHPRRRLRPTPVVRAALLVASAGIAAAVAALVWSQLPQQLNVHTDIVGYPEAANFNIERYFWAYGLVAGLFPFLTLALYLLMRRTLAPGTARPLGVIEFLDRRAPAASGDRVNLAVSAGAILLVGITLGFEIAIGGGWQDLGGIVLAVAATAYGLAVATIAAVAVAGPLRGRELDVVLPGVNAVLATLTVLGLAWVSAGTKVTVSSDGTVHHYPWFPWWLGALVTVGLLATIVLAIRRSVAARTIERRILVLVVTPVLLFLFVAVLPGAPGDMDSFHEGEQLGAAHLTAAGRFPWRDLLFIHGPLGDVLQPLLNIHVFGDTRWANLAGEAVLSKPAAVVSLFLLCAYLFRDNWLFLLGTQVAIVTGWVFALQVQSSRLLFVPIVILLLAALLTAADLAESDRLHDPPAHTDRADARRQLHGARVSRRRRALRARASSRLLADDSLRDHDGRPRRGLDRLPGLLTRAGRLHLLLPHLRPRPRAHGRPDRWRSARGRLRPRSEGTCTTSSQPALRSC